MTTPPPAKPRLLRDALSAFGAAARLRGFGGAAPSAHAHFGLTFSRAATHFPFPFPLSFPVIFSRSRYRAPPRSGIPSLGSGAEPREGGSAAGGGVAVPLTCAHVFGGARGAATMEQVRG